MLDESELPRLSAPTHPSEMLTGSQSAHSGDRRRRQLLCALAAVLILVSLGRIASTYKILSQFCDEPYHVASGLEWWQNRSYHIAEQPPLSHIFNAALLYFHGVRVADFSEAFAAGNTALTAAGEYGANLTRARLGTLPFWIAACLLVFVIGSRLYNMPAGLLSLLFLSTLPPLLGFAGVAYTDMALAMGVLLFAWRWMEFAVRPDRKRALWLGVSIGVAVGSKYSAIPYIMLTPILTALAFWGRKPSLPSRAAALLGARLTLYVVLSAFLVIWASFRFSVRPISEAPGRPHQAVDRLLGHSGLLRRAAYLSLESPLPLTELVHGVRQVIQHAKAGHTAYNFGKVRRTGTLYYFPVLLVVTIPVGLIILAALGSFPSNRKLARQPALLWQSLYAVPVAAFLVNVTSSINIGYRHNLAVYPFVCLLAAAGCLRLWRSLRFQRVARLLATALVTQCLVSSAMAHPNYSSFFNFLAGAHPEEICMSSREQGDVWRLAARLRELRADHVCVALGSPLPLNDLGLPPHTVLQRNVPCTGWVAVNLYRARIDTEDPEAPTSGLEWLQAYQPQEQVGTTIRIYKVPEGALHRQPFSGGGAATLHR